MDGSGADASPVGIPISWMSVADLRKEQRGEEWKRTCLPSAYALLFGITEFIKRQSSFRFCYPS